MPVFGKNDLPYDLDAAGSETRSDLSTEFRTRSGSRRLTELATQEKGTTQDLVSVWR